MSNNIKDWIRPEIQSLSAYHVPNPGDMIKLDAMENPFGWPADMIAEWQSMLTDTALNRYPDPGSHDLRAQIRRAFDIPENMEILLGNGSDEIIQIIAMSVAEKSRVILAPEPGFVMYEMIARYVGMDYVGVPLHANDFSLDMPAMREAIKTHNPAVIFIAYPNNPTGNLFDADQVCEIIELAPGLVVVDEAYTAFADDSFISKLGQYSNLLVMRTVSKMGLAGLRLGYLAGPADWLNEFDKIRLPYNINVLTQQTAAFALKHKAVLDQQTETLKKERTRLFEHLSDLPGLNVFPSQANFLLVHIENLDANMIFQKLKEAGILVKNLANAPGALNNCLRITVGTPDENQLFLKAFKDILT